MAEKEVHFARYCRTCKYHALPETEDPCDECLAYPVNEDSHCPVYYMKQSKTSSQK